MRDYISFVKFAEDMYKIYASHEILVKNHKIKYNFSMNIIIIINSTYTLYRDQKWNIKQEFANTSKQIRNVAKPDLMAVYLSGGKKNSTADSV